MTALHATSSQPPSAVRATVPAAAACLLLWGIAMLAGLLPAGAGGPAALGIGLAALAVLLASLLHGRMLAARTPDARSPGLAAAVSGANVTRALALGFGLKLLALCLGIGVLLLCGAKFAAAAAFALAFAGTALLCQGGAAWALSRQQFRNPVSPGSPTDAPPGPPGTRATTDHR